MRHQSAPTAAGINPVTTAVGTTKTPRRRDKATYRGTCQVCGRLQKLPGNVLSKHGYTKRWGFFEGMCPGAHYKPFEQAYDRIQVAIDRTKVQIQNLQDERTRLEGPTDPTTNEAPFRSYNAYLGGYYESTVIVSLVDGLIQLTEKTTADNPKKHWGNQYGLHGNVEHAILKLRHDRISRIVSDIQRRNEYIRWQEKRIAEWKPGVLQPVKEVA